MNNLCNITTADELMSFLREALNLDNHTITFHVIEGAVIAGGLIDDPDDLYDSDAFCQIADAYCGDKKISLSDIVTYQIGDGESDSATAREVEILTEARKRCPAAFDELLYKYSDILAVLEDLTVSNPYYDSDDDSDDDD